MIPGNPSLGNWASAPSSAMLADPDCQVRGMFASFAPPVSPTALKSRSAAAPTPSACGQSRLP